MIVSGIASVVIGRHQLLEELQVRWQLDKVARMDEDSRPALLAVDEDSHSQHCEVAPPALVVIADEEGEEPRG